MLYNMATSIVLVAVSHLADGSTDCPSTEGNVCSRASSDVFWVRTGGGSDELCLGGVDIDHSSENWIFSKVGDSVYSD